MDVDVRIEGVGFYSIYGESDAGSKWLGENVDLTEDGQVYTDDTRCAVDIAKGATDDGLVVAVNGFVYVAGGLRGVAA